MRKLRIGKLSELTDWMSYMQDAKSTENDSFWLNLIEEEEKPRKPIRPIVLNENYPHLPKDGSVKLVERSAPCASQKNKCRSPTWYRFRGIPYCSTHLIILLTEELLANSTGEEIANTRRDGSSPTEREFTIGKIRARVTSNDGRITNLETGDSIRISGDRKYLDL